MINFKGFMNIEQRGDEFFAVCVNPLTHKRYDFKVTEDQADRILEWYCGNAPMIQEILSDLTAEQRELLLSGNNNESWNSLFPNDGDD